MQFENHNCICHRTAWFNYLTLIENMVEQELWSRRATESKGIRKKEEEEKNWKVRGLRGGHPKKIKRDLVFLATHLKRDPIKTGITTNPNSINNSSLFSFRNQFLIRIFYVNDFSQLTPSH